MASSNIYCDWSNSRIPYGIINWVGKMTREPARLLRGAVEESEEERVRPIAQALGQALEERSYTQRFLEAIQDAGIEPEPEPETESDPWHEPDEVRPFRTDGIERTSVSIDDDVEAIVQLHWGNESFTIHFPIKEEGEVTHDVPVGRIEWIVGTREEEEEEEGEIIHLEELGEEALEELLDHIDDDDDDYGDYEDDDSYDDGGYDDEDDDY